jgi:hypothetical protein
MYAMIKTRKVSLVKLMMNYWLMLKGSVTCTSWVTHLVNNLCLLENANVTFIDTPHRILGYTFFNKAHIKIYKRRGLQAQEPCPRHQNSLHHSICPSDGYGSSYGDLSEADSHRFCFFDVPSTTSPPSLLASHDFSFKSTCDRYILSFSSFPSLRHAS